MDKNSVVLQPWQESWPYEFHVAQQWIIAAALVQEEELGLLDVRHVGGTSIKGMISKPIIDILVCPEKDIPLEQFVPYFETIGFKNLGDGGRTGRLFLVLDNGSGMAWHMHLCCLDHPVAQDQLLFQHILRTNPDVFQDYYDLKVILATLFDNDRISYRKTKGFFINSVLSAYRQGKGNPCFMD